MVKAVAFDGIVRLVVGAVDELLVTDTFTYELKLAPVESHALTVIL